jgi:hypothetical protein
VTPPLGTRGPALAASTIPPLSVRPFGTRSATHKRDKPLPVRTNHRPALSRVRDPKPIPSPPGTTGGPGSSLSDIRRISLEGKGPRTWGETRVTCHLPGNKKMIRKSREREREREREAQKAGERECKQELVLHAGAHWGAESLADEE